MDFHETYSWLTHYVNIPYPYVLPTLVNQNDQPYSLL